MTRRGTFMGFTDNPGSVNLALLRDRAYLNSCRYIRNGFEVPWLMNSTDANNATYTPGYPPLNVAPLQAEVDATHAAGKSYILGLLGVPRKVNPNAGTSDPAADGNWHWYPTDSAGRAAMAAYAVSICSTLSAFAGDMFEPYQESNIPDFNHKTVAGVHDPNNTGASAAVVAVAMAEVIIAVRAAYPTLPIILGSPANRGDIHNTTDIANRVTGSLWLADILAADSRLVSGSARPDYVGYHPYVGDTDPLATYSPGWGMPQMIEAGAVMAFGGCTKPDGSAQQMCVTEYGTIRARYIAGFTGTGSGSANLQCPTGNFETFEQGAGLVGPNIQAGTSVLTVTSPTQVVMSKPATGVISGTVTVEREAFQASQIQKCFTAFDGFRAAGWVAGPETHSFMRDAALGIIHVDAPYNEYQAGTLWEFYTQIDDASPPITPGTPGTAPAIKIELGIRPRSDSGPYFTIGTTGLGSTTKTLAPEIFWYDITARLLSADLMQGRIEELGRTSPGTLTFDLDNRDRALDPTYSASPFYPNLLRPRPQLRITVDGVPWATVMVDVRDPKYFVAGAEVTIGGHDGLARLAKTKVRFLHPRQQSSGSRIHKILDAAGWKGGRAIWAGAFQMGAYPMDVEALDEIARICEAEDTLVHCDPTNILVVVDRATLNDGPSFVFADDGTGDAGYQTCDYSGGYDLFANVVSFLRRPHNDDDHPERQYYSDHASINEHDTVERPYDDSPVADDVTAAYAAYQIGSRWAQPVSHIKSVTLHLADFNQPKRLSLGLLFMGGRVRVIHHPDGGGPAITQDSLIIGRKLWGGDEPTKYALTYFLKTIDGGA